ncbi:MAG: asparagine synthase (glutamine-hydrolyzing) [Candidatus Orphnella occulta]|nr:asparagine synthase (glutamine-hydrolyzing) [Candidatus Orphnella occulta]
MCGICGYQGDFQSGLINRMMGLISHRGPDDQGFLEDNVNQTALGHTRLSIIDLRLEARQPLKNEDGSIYLICNGEIYNYKELRQELISKGHKFRSSTDSEVLIHLYEDEGIELLSRLNGIFSFAIYNRNKNELFCARDQLGVKPFYYAQERGCFIFASELKAILANSQVSREIDPVAIHNHLTFLWSPSPVTMFKSIRKLEPGFALLVKNNRIERHWCYYDIPYCQKSLITSEDEAVRLVRESLTRSVERQMMSDVPLGAFLSGGLDSSSVVAMMKKVNPDIQPRCFTISFAGGQGYEGFVNDLPYARKVAKHLQVNLEEIVIEADIANNLEKVIYFLDEPQADLAPINIKLICQRAQEQGIKVLLSGAGGDDIFSGYSRHKALYLEKYWSWLPNPCRKLLGASARSLPVGLPAARRIRKMLENAALSQDERSIAYFFWLSQNRIKGLYNDSMRQALSEYNSFAPMKEHLAAIPDEKNKLNRMLYLDSKTFLPDHNLNYTDKMSMAHGVEVRVPLLDVNLVNLCTRISPHLKQNGLMGKYVFRKSMEPFLPHDVIYRPKGAIPGPLRNWLLSDLKPMVHDMLSEERIKRRGWFNYKAVHKLISDNESMKIDASYPIWAMVSMEMWANLFLDRVLD